MSVQRQEEIPSPNRVYIHMRRRGPFLNLNQQLILLACRDSFGAHRDRAGQLLSSSTPRHQAGFENCVSKLRCVCVAMLIALKLGKETGFQFSIYLGARIYWIHCTCELSYCIPEPTQVNKPSQTTCFEVWGQESAGFL